ncbi:Fcf1-domain-containing protein, partial [Clavulina sp. PMI_390]
MRQKRAKTYKKLMKLYSRSFGFRQPYQVLVDSTFCTYAAQNKIDIPKQLGVVLQGQQKQMITQCSMVELYNLGPSHQAVVDMAKTFERRKCNHREAIPNDDCIKSVVGDTNKHRYVVATQSQPLRVSLRAIPSVPIVHINRVVMVLEPPSDTTLRAKALQEADAQAAKPTELAAIASTTPVAESSEPPRKKRKGPKEPNPLSVKKKKPKAPQGSTATATKPSTSKTSHH